MVINHLLTGMVLQVGTQAPQGARLRTGIRTAHFDVRHLGPESPRHAQMGWLRIFGHETYLEPQGQQFINGCFNWMIPNLYIGNGWKSPNIYL